MTGDRLADGRRIAELLASEVEGHGDELAALAVADADRDVEPTPDGALAYRIVRADDGAEDEDGQTTDDGVEDENRSAGDDAEREADGRERVAAVYVQPERVRIEFAVGQAAVAAAAESAGLRVRPKAVRPPRTLVFVESGAEVKRALNPLAAAVDAQSD